MTKKLRRGQESGRRGVRWILAHNRSGRRRQSGRPVRCALHTPTPTPDCVDSSAMLLSQRGRAPTLATLSLAAANGELMSMACLTEALRESGEDGRTVGGHEQRHDRHQQPRFQGLRFDAQRRDGQLKNGA